MDGAAYVSRRDLFVPGLGEEDFLIYIPPALENTLLTSLALLDAKGFEDFELVHANSEVRVYKLKQQK